MVMPIRAIGSRKAVSTSIQIGDQMELESRACQSWSYWLWAGSGLMSMALFIHPISPEDFLALACSDPLQTLKDDYGIQAAMMFWVSVMLLGIGVIRGLACLFFGKRPTTSALTRHRPVKSAPYAICAQQENMEEYWSYR
jgi:hypothetical protein